MVALNSEKTLDPYAQLIKNHERQLLATLPVVSLGMNEDEDDKHKIRPILDPVKEGARIGYYLAEPAEICKHAWLSNLQRTFLKVQRASKTTTGCEVSH